MALKSNYVQLSNLRNQLHSQINILILIYESAYY